MTNWSDFDRLMMREALIEAYRGLMTTRENPRVGCVITRGKDILAAGYHAFPGGPHAEINALSQVSDASGATCYITLEPCTHFGKTEPCVDALIDAGLARVVCAMSDPNPKVNGSGIRALRHSGISVDVGLFETYAARLNPGFIKRMKSGQPFVWMKNAASLDGKTALASGESKWITGSEARRDIHQLRGRVGALITGVDTIITDDPRLTFRPEELGLTIDAPQPIRVILDSKGRLPETARFFDFEGDIIWVTYQRESHAHLKSGRMISWIVPGGNGRIDLMALLMRLADRGINEVLVEAGQTLSGAFLQSGFIDRGVTYFAPKFLGEGARSLYHIAPTRIDDAPKICVEDWKLIGCDLRLEWILRANEPCH